MSTVIPTQGNSILVDTPESVGDSVPMIDDSAGQITAWVMDRVTRWEDHREQSWGYRWREYWRMWRGQWTAEDRNRASERCRLIAPALSQAIDQTVSEIQEASFGKETWFDLPDGTDPQSNIAAAMARDEMLEDFEVMGVKDALSDAILNAAIFGTGAVQLSVEVGRSEAPSRDPETMELSLEGEDRVYVRVDSIRPDQLIPDPSGTTVDDMLGIAVRRQRPLHSVLERIERGIYLRSALRELGPRIRSVNYDVDSDTDLQSSVASREADTIDVIEYHGKVPLKFLQDLKETKTLVDELLAEDEERRPMAGDGPLVEAIVTIAGDGILLRAIMNPFTMCDRSIIAFPFERVPGRFWGRGVAEKGINPQKALDAEVRSRIDALGYLSAPMLGVDAGRVPRGFKPDIFPGKVWMTNGAPSEILTPVGVGQINPATFNQASEMERMVQMGTGAFDTASSLNSQSQSGASGLSSNSMMMGAFVKRAKRAVQQIDRSLLTPVIRKAMWRYMQFDPERFQQDYSFQVKTTMGIVAREVEAAQMSQMIGMMPEQFANVQLSLVQGVIEHSALPNKAVILQQIQQALQPPSEEEQQRQQQLQDMQYQAVLAQAEGAILANQKTIAEIRKLMAEAQATTRKGDLEDDKLIQEQMRLQLMAQELDQFAEQNKIANERLEIQRQAVEIRAKQASKKSGD